MNFNKGQLLYKYNLFLMLCVLAMLCIANISGYGLFLDRGERMQNWTKETQIYLYSDLKDLPADMDHEWSVVMTYSSFFFDVGKRKGYILSITLEVTFPALVYSLMEYKKQHPWTEQYKFYLVFINDDCAPEMGIPRIIEMKEAGTDVIFGVPCSLVTIPAGFYLKHWNLPLITYASNDPSVSNKNIYSTVVRVGVGYNYLAVAFVELFKAFKWRTASLLLRDFGLCKFGGEYLYPDFKENSILVAEYVRMEETVSDADILQYLRNFKERARILIVCHKDPQMRRIMELADAEGMVTPEYVYLTFYLSPTKSSTYPWGDITGLSQEEVNKKHNIYKQLKTLTPGDITGPDKQAFLQDIENMVDREYPWTMNIPRDELRITDSPYALYLYDTMQLYMEVFNESLNDGYDLRRNGSLVFEKAANRIFEGASGEVILDNHADRIPIYWLWQLEPDAKAFTHFASIRVISEEGKRVQVLNTPHWGTRDGMPPPSMPDCGYRLELCPPTNKGGNTAFIVGISCTALIVIVTMVSVIYYRHKKYEADLQRMTWKVLFEDIQFTNKRVVGSTVGMSMKSIMSSKSRSGASSFHEYQIFTKVGLVKGMLCAVKKILKSDYKPSRSDLIELKSMKDLNHENINVFIGLSLHTPHVYILSQYCSKGSLQDILENDDIKLDKMFKTSLINDLASGMAYLHDSPLQSHGQLKSINCLIDSRWVLKISNYGLKELKYRSMNQETCGNLNDELWTAPELLRLDISSRPLKGTQKSDVYSFAIILHEILFRVLPYFQDSADPIDLIQRIKKQSDPPFRPHIPADNIEVDPKMVSLMCECWEELPTFRPEFKVIKKKLIQNNKGRKINILDNMVAKLESYANNLEEIVEKRTEELMDEKKKTDILLYRMLPSSVAEKLKHGLMVKPEMYECVTIYFSDIVGFTAIAAQSLPMQIVDLLNDLYSLFDDVIEKYDVYKVETIGDAYMCVSGLPNRNGERHTVEIANMSLDLRDCVKRFRIRHLPDRSLMIRIGIHTGSCAAGVVGLTMPRYCLFGDTVNVASRMESNGEAMKIHVSTVTYEILNQTGQYELKLRGDVALKGKGTITSYWLEGRA